MKKQNYISFEKVREQTRKLNLKSKTEWLEYWKKNKKPDNIPKTLDKVYKKTGDWKNWGDFLGTCNLPFEEVRKFVKKLNLKNRLEWNSYWKENKRPNNIPKNPNDAYKNKGWEGWADFLGTNKFSNQNKISFEKLKLFVQNKEIKSGNEWNSYWKKNKRPINIPLNPDRIYKKTGDWKGWGDFLGTNVVAPRDRVYLSFEELKLFVQDKEIKNVSEWDSYWKKNKRPSNIPAEPHRVYKKTGDWKSWGDFLGTGIIASFNKVFLSFEDAKVFAIKLKLSGNTEWRKYVKGELTHLQKKPDNIPSTPESVYKDNGWINWPDFLGTSYVSFEKAKKYAKKLKLKSQKEWFNYCKNNKPNNIPKNPDRCEQYKDKWTNWDEFLDIYKLNFKEAREYARKLNLKKYIEWEKYWKENKIPNNIPKYPDAIYKNEWKGWADFLGYLGDGNIWTKTNLIAYIEQIKDYIYVCSIPQLLTIIESNGLYRYITKEKIKKLQDTKPDSKEREDLTKEIINELTSSEELEEQDATIEDLTEVEVENIINEENKEEDENYIDKTELNIKQLKALDNDVITASLDDERVQFIVSDLINNLWYSLLNNKLKINEIKKLTFNNSLPQKIKEDFLSEYDSVMNLKMPDGWTYSYEPLLMQKLISYRLLKNKRYGNWSGAGAGKTVSGILAGRYIGAKNTLVITFNSTIGREDERGWTKEIRDSFKDSKIYTKFDKNIKFDDRYYNYLVLNYETFQQKGSANYVIDLLEKNKIDYVIFDEVQSVKQRKITDESKRREVIFGLVSKIKKLNPDYYLLAMSATPVINNLVEAKSLIELIEFEKLDDINTNPNVSNCIELFRRLTNYGIRHKNIEDNILKNNKFTTINIEANELYAEASKLTNDDILDKETLTLNTKLKAITPYLNSSEGKTVIYTHYVDGMEDSIYDYLTYLGYKVGVYTGGSSKRSRETTLSSFIKGKYDILLGSRPIATGVDGLQFVSDRIIILSLPWTNAELEQLQHRVNRKNSKFKEVDIIIPLVSIKDQGNLYKWDEHKFNTITYKATIANAVVDGIIPDKIIKSRDILEKEANDNMDEWIDRLKGGNILTVDREGLFIKPSPETNDEENRRKKIESELSEFNRVGKTTLSSTMNKRFNEDPKSWYYYHELRRKSMKDWEEIPYEVIAKEIICIDDKIIDFGCGDNCFKDCVENEVTSVDHIAIDKSVIACDMKDLSNFVKDETHDVAVFSLSLWGTNYSDYLKEAHRVLKRKGMVYIAESSKYYESIDKQNELVELMNNVGFKIVGKIDVREKFTYITGIKIKNIIRN